MAISNPYSMNRKGHHPSILVASDRLQVMNEWWSSLRYSTHVTLHFVTSLENTAFDSFNTSVHIVPVLSNGAIGQFINVLNIDWLFDDFSKEYINRHSENIEVNYGNYKAEVVKYPLSVQTINVEVTKSPKLKPTSQVPVVQGPDDIGLALRKIRMKGYNVPLNIVQALMGRDQIFPAFLNLNVLSPDGILLRPCKIFFDLDETLILLGKPIQVSVEFLRKCFKSRLEIYLVTRHIYNIEDTLESIGLSNNLFTQIYKVSTSEKKGDVLLELGCSIDDLFIDNEFPERWDVRRKTGMNVIDVNQIEFVNFI